MRTPSFIAPPKQRKPRATKADGAQVANQPEPAAQATPDSASHSQNGESTSRAGSVRKADSTTRKATKRRRNGDEVEVSGGEGLQSVHPVEREATVDLLRSLASRPQMVDLFEQVRPGSLYGAVQAMLGGAVVAGAHGAADRASMWRVLGMPWVGENNGGKQATAILGAVLGEAVARLEQHRGRAPVTVDATAEAKVLAGKGD